MLNLSDWITVAITVGFTSFCAELAKDLKKYLVSRIQKGHSKLAKKLQEAAPAATN